MRDIERKLKERQEKVLDRWKTIEIQNELRSMKMMFLKSFQIAPVYHLVVWKNRSTTLTWFGEKTIVQGNWSKLCRVKVISKALRRSRVDLKDPKRPIGSFMFCTNCG